MEALRARATSTHSLKAGALHPSLHPSIRPSVSLTQDTTLPLKQGSLALSSEISSLTTLGRGQTRRTSGERRSTTEQRAAGVAALRRLNNQTLISHIFHRREQRAAADDGDEEPFTDLTCVSYANHANLFHATTQDTTQTGVGLQSCMRGWKDDLHVQIDSSTARSMCVNGVGGKKNKVCTNSNCAMLLTFCQKGSVCCFVGFFFYPNYF